MTNTLTTQNKSTAFILKLLGSDPRLVSHHTTRQYKSDLLNFEAWRNSRPLTKTLVEAYAAELQAGGYAPASINQKLAVIRWYARKLVDLATDYQQDKELAERAARVAQVEDVKGETPQRGRHIEQGELVALLQACTSDLSPSGIRDAAMIALAWATGLRRDEISQMALADFTTTSDGIDIVVKGKGSKVRTAYLNNGALSALQDWLMLRGSDPGRVFVCVTKSGKVKITGRLSGESMRKILDKRSLQAALSKPITWHDFRRTFAGNLWGAGIDGVTIQKLMGHASQNQTAEYDRRPEEGRRQAVKVLHVPYKSKGIKP